MNRTSSRLTFAGSRLSSHVSRFRRITRSTSYLPHIDGLRFLAILWVVAMHIIVYIDKEVTGAGLTGRGYWGNLVVEGGQGVALFFVISGFILSLPFAQAALGGGAAPSLRRFYLRRILRLESPYLVALALFFILHQWVDKYSEEQLGDSFILSSLYLHNALAGTASRILPVAWSLEVEVQFYLLAPFLCLLFRLPALPRRAVLVAIMAWGTVYWYGDWGPAHLLKFIHLFAGGLLLADLHVSGPSARPAPLVQAFGWAALAGFAFLLSIDSLAAWIGKTVCIWVLFYAVLQSGKLQRVFSIRPLALIGGMCYSIYLLHYGFISGAGQLLVRLGWQPAGAGTIAFGLLLAAVVLAASAVFFLLIEKPAMRSRKSAIGNRES